MNEPDEPEPYRVERLERSVADLADCVDMIADLIGHMPGVDKRVAEPARRTAIALKRTCRRIRERLPK